MATYTQVKTDLDEIGKRISIAESKYDGFTEKVNNFITALTAIPTDYADSLSTIQGYGNSNAAEANSKAERAKFVTEYQATLAKYQALKVFLDAQ